MFGPKTAEKLDAAAGALNKAGKKVAGERGGRAADALASKALGPLRDRCDADCTCKRCC